MKYKNLKKSFLNFCETNKLEKNPKQLEIINLLNNFIKPKKFFLNNLFSKKDELGFYLFGDVGVGKTMLLNHLYEFCDMKKQRYHFNEFMIKFHDYKHKDKSNSILSFVQKLKDKYELIYLDEFQVTNIVDAMILGKLFETIFDFKIKVLITSNTKIDDLYKDGLQRDQFVPFISTFKDNSIQKELVIEDDYRKLSSSKLQRIFYPINEKNTFKINLLFRDLTKDRKRKKLTIDIKGRKFIITDFYDGVAKFDFNQLCNTNIGAEDYIKIAKYCSIIVILNVPYFNDDNINQQQRFITLIDILYEKKISIMISISSKLENIGSSKKLLKPFKRTLSRILQLTLPKKSLS